MDKRGAADTGKIFLGVIAAIAVLMYVQQFGIPFTASAKGGVSGTGTGNGGAITVNVNQSCTVDSTIVTFGATEDKYWGNKVSYPYHRWYLASGGSSDYVDQGYVADGTTKTLAPKDKLRIFYGLNNSATSHYAAFAEMEVPCTGAFTTATADSKYKDAYKLYNMTRAGDMVFNVNNQNGAVNSAGAPQAITAGQVRKMNFEIDFPNRAAYGAVAGPDGNTGSFLMMCFLNNTYWDSEGFSLASGKDLYAGALPQRISVPSGFSTKAWQFDAQTSNGKVTDTMVIDADDTIPSTSTNQNINCTLVDKSWYLPTNSNTPAFGYETDTQTDVGAVDLSFLFRTNGTG